MDALHIPDCKVTHLPDVLVHLTRLKSLSAFGDLMEIPDWLSQHPHLTKLDFAVEFIDEYTARSPVNKLHFTLNSII